MRREPKSHHVFPMLAWAVAVSCWLGSSAEAQSTTAAPGGEPVAVVAGKAITEAELEERIQPQLQQLRNQEYEVRKQALESLINQRLVEAEAERQGISMQELLEREVDSTVPEPTDAEISAFYEGQKERINRPLEEVKGQIQQLLRQNRQQQMRQSYLERLRGQAEIAIHLVPPRIAVSSDPDRMLGPPDAPVQIVEFSDFQCPYCQRAYLTVRALLEKYGDRISLSYRDFPLRNIHPQAQAAAHAARCAGEQGKFWQYHNSLFEMPNQLGRDELVLHAATVGLDTDQFRACQESGRYNQAIEEDLQAGMQAGVSGTPAFFINGILVSGSQPASVFEKTIEAELAAREPRGTSAH